MNFDETFNQALADTFSKIEDEVIQQAKEDFEKKCREKMAEIAISLSRSTMIERFGDKIVIEVRFTNGGN